MQPFDFQFSALECVKECLQVFFCDKLQLTSHNLFVDTMNGEWTSLISI